MEDMEAMGLWQGIEKYVLVSWAVMNGHGNSILVLLNLAEGSSVSEIEKLKQDDGLRCSKNQKGK